MGIKERKERERALRMNDILDSAEQLIFEHGYEKTSIDMIAELSELSKGTVYLYFKSKESIYFAIAERGKAILIKYLKKASAKEKKGFKKIMAMTQAYLKFYKENFKYFQAITYSESIEMKFDPEDKFFKDCTLEDLFVDETPLSIFVEALNIGIKDGTILKDVDPILTAFTVWSQATGVIQFMNTRGLYIETAFKFKIVKLWETFVEHLERSIKS